MQRMTLAVQGATETYSTDDLALMDTEYQQLESEITRIVTQTKWNKQSDGSGGSGGAGAFIIQLVLIMHNP